MSKQPFKKLAAIYEADDPSFQNIMGGPHYNIVDLNCDVANPTRADCEVVATVWIDDDAEKCERDAILLSAAPDLLRACNEALDWAEAQDESRAPQWIRRMAKAVRKAERGDKNTQVFYD